MRRHAGAYRTGSSRGKIEAKERRAAQIDARGLWPIAFGIVLTGIPGELAEVTAIGIAAMVTAVGGTFYLGWRVIRTWREDRA